MSTDILSAPGSFVKWNSAPLHALQAWERGIRKPNPQGRIFRDGGRNRSTRAAVEALPAIRRAQVFDDAGWRSRIRSFSNAGDHLSHFVKTWTSKATTALVKAVASMPIRTHNICL